MMAMSQKKSICVLLPTYFDTKSLKVLVPELLKKFDEFFETLFPGKKIDEEINVNDLIIELTNNPELYSEKMILTDQISKFINFGEYKLAIR